MSDINETIEMADPLFRRLNEIDGEWNAEVDAAQKEAEALAARLKSCRGRCTMSFAETLDEHKTIISSAIARMRVLANDRNAIKDEIERIFEEMDKREENGGK